jgi:hypothetical protein
MVFPFVSGKKLAEGAGNAPTSVMPILFSRQVQPAYICLPSGFSADLIRKFGASGRSPIAFSYGNVSNADCKLQNGE